ncbi:MAG: hypothetical protein FJ241_09805 [Nitrospira sp.]|nr:hypothetical protein [Nitrospira sp.]
MENKNDDIAKAVEKGIKSEKTKEAIGVFMTIGFIGLSIIIGVSIHWMVGLVSFFGGLYGTWKYYKS